MKRSYALLMFGIFLILASSVYAADTRCVYKDDFNNASSTSLWVDDNEVGLGLVPSFLKCYVLLSF